MGKPTWESLLAFLRKGTRLDGNDYRGNVEGYRADRARIVRDREDARILISHAQAQGIEAAACIGRRLDWSAEHGWEYTPGQYYPVEVCGGVANAVADAIYQRAVDVRLADPGIDLATGKAPENPCAGLREATIAYLAAVGGLGSRRVGRWFR